ncbi:ester cyclase [Streptomyces sp. NPDC001851]|uniref:ester cyclase n=1 Tax=Streptomyces sp. NPDC001851 TaxID=3154529 RepID=UPI0033166496
MNTAATPAHPTGPGRSPQDLWNAWNRLWNGDYAIADDFVSRTMRVNIPRHGMPDPGTLTDGPQIAAWISAFRSSYEDDASITGELGPFFAGDYAIGRWVFRGTWKGGRPATATAGPGTEVTFRGVDILRFEDGRVAEYWLSDDQLDLYDQLGAVGGPAAPQGRPAPAEKIAALSPDAGRSLLLEHVLDLTAELLEDERVRDTAGTETFLSLGLESLHAVALRDQLETEYAVALASTVVFDHPTPQALAHHLWTQLNSADGTPPADLPATLDRLEELAAASQGDERAQLADRLAALAERLAPAAGTAPEELDNASATELFAYLDSRLGTTRQPQ